MARVWCLVPSVSSESRCAEFTICAPAFLSAVSNLAALQRHQGRGMFPEWSGMNRHADNSLLCLLPQRAPYRYVSGAGVPYQPTTPVLWSIDRAPQRPWPDIAAVPGICMSSARGSHPLENGRLPLRDPFRGAGLPQLVSEDTTKVSWRMPPLPPCSLGSGKTPQEQAWRKGEQHFCGWWWDRALANLCQTCGRAPLTANTTQHHALWILRAPE